MIIDKDKFKEYINTKYSDVLHINDIESTSLINMRYYKDQIPKGSKYSEYVQKNGSVKLLMIKSTWSGWKVVNEKFCTSTRWKEFIGTWSYRDNRLNRFNLDDYQQWLIDVRDKKLESIGI